MPKVSRIKLSDQHLHSLRNTLWMLITLLENKGQVNDFFSSLLTHTEIEMISKRIAIAKMLQDGYNYQDIKGYLCVTDSTIARISNVLANDQKFRTFISHLQKIDQKNDEKRMGTGLDLVDKYPMYFLPDKIIKSVNKKRKSIIKKSSATK